MTISQLQTKYTRKNFILHQFQHHLKKIKSKNINTKNSKIQLTIIETKKCDVIENSFSLKSSQISCKFIQKTRNFNSEYLSF